jgi:hypothetical protein
MLALLMSAARNILPNTTSGIFMKRRKLKQFYRENDPTNSMNPALVKQRGRNTGKRAQTRAAHNANV